MLDEDSIKLIKETFKGVEIPEERESEFLSFWKEYTFSKKEIITGMHDIEKKLYLVKKGVQVIYLWNRGGEMVVLGFTFDGSLSGVYDSLLTRTPSKYDLLALSDSELLGINYEDYLRLFDLASGFEKWFRLFNQSILFGRHSREVELLTLNASERYRAFMKRCPDQLKEIPQKYLASYLNMKPETFSRLRASVDY